jgi:hypothetical protein
MNDQLSEQTKKLRKQYARTFHNDGLIDFFVGWALVSVGIFLQTSLMIFSFLGWMPIMLILPLKQRYVIPRFGYVKFSKPTTIPIPILSGAGALIVIGSLLLSFLSGNNGFSSSISVAIMGVGLLLLIGTGMNRVTLYAVFVPLLFIVGLGLNILSPVLVMLIGAILMLLGIYLFVNFIRKYPVDSGEETENK